MPGDSTIVWNNKTYKSKANLIPYAVAAFGTHMVLKHWTTAPKPLRFIHPAFVWLGFGGLAVALSFSRVEPEQKVQTIIEDKEHLGFGGSNIRT